MNQSQPDVNSPTLIYHPKTGREEEREGLEKILNCPVIDDLCDDSQSISIPQQMLLSC